MSDNKNIWKISDNDSDNDGEGVGDIENDSDNIDDCDDENDDNDDAMRYKYNDDYQGMDHLIFDMGKKEGRLSFFLLAVLNFFLRFLF